MEKVFVIFNTACIGDILVTNTLVRNIKKYYPKSVVVFVCNEPYKDAARYQDGVDDVITYDKNKVTSLKRIIDFVKNFPYKKPYASFVIYSNERNLILARLIGAKHIISHHTCKLWNTKEKYPLREYEHMKDKIGGMIEALTGSHENLPIKYIPPSENTPVIQAVKSLKNPVVLCTTSNFAKKDMKPEDGAELIYLLKQDGYTPILTGAGLSARNFSSSVKRLGCLEFVDLADCTSLTELANILKICGRCISVDTGTLHFANALSIPVTGIFYTELEHVWGSDETLYPAKILSKNAAPQDIMNAFRELNNEVYSIF